MEILLLEERIRNSILVGESDFREFKSAFEGKPDNKKPRLAKKICEDIAEALVAFANTDGGELIIGVEDDGTVTGIPHPEGDIQMMLSAITTHVFDGQRLPVVRKTKTIIDGKLLLFFQVEKGTSEIYQLSDGRVLVRKDKQTVPNHIRKILIEWDEIRSREYDKRYVDGATVPDLDMSLLYGSADRYIKGMTIEKYLQQLGLIEYTMSGFRVRMATLLLFAKDIQRWHPRSQIRLMEVSGTELLSGERYNVLHDEVVQGNINELVVKGWELLRPRLAYKTEYVKGNPPTFEERYIYPKGACQEILLNALAHRDYYRSNGIEIYLFDNRMEIRSPGPLLSSLTVEDIELFEKRHESRNVNIAHTLKVNKQIRETGEGMARIYTLMREAGLPKPELHSNTVWFTVTLFNGK
jgi:ATP-dependent DNA helicase RecG